MVVRTARVRVTYVAEVEVALGEDGPEGWPAGLSASKAARKLLLDDRLHGGVDLGVLDLDAGSSEVSAAWMDDTDDGADHSIADLFEDGGDA